MVTLKTVLDFLDSGQTFEQMAFVTCDAHRKKGGEWIEVKNACKHEFMTSREMAKLAKAQPKFGITKDPRHNENSTRNIRLHNGEIRKLHIRLIRQFNYKTVL